MSLTSNPTNHIVLESNHDFFTVVFFISDLLGLLHCCSICLVLLYLSSTTCHLISCLYSILPLTSLLGIGNLISHKDKTYHRVHFIGSFPLIFILCKYLFLTLLVSKCYSSTLLFEVKHTFTKSLY